MNFENKENDEVNKSDHLKEPQVTYAGSKQIIFFKSKEEENEYTWRQYASMTPEERLAAVTRMRLTAFPNLNSDLHPWGDTI